MITLSGSGTVTHAQGTSYTDAGATWSDTEDGTGSLTASGSVNTSQTGSYTLSYDYTDAQGNAATQVTRIVNVTDQTIPIITLNGSGSITQEALLPYTDAGATWIDNVDGSGSLTASGTVITDILGTYPLYFDYTDTSGNAALQVIRNVTITAPSCNPGSELNTSTG